jgi:hypothetical protein
MTHDIQNNADNKSPWETNVALLGIRWIAFIPVGFILSILLNMLVLISFTWMTENDGRMLIKDFFFSGYPLFGLVIAGGVAYGISMLTTHICPKPRIGAVVYGILYILYALSTLINFYGQDNISKVVATIVVIGVSVGSMIGVVSAYSEAES